MGRIAMPRLRAGGVFAIAGSNALLVVGLLFILQVCSSQSLKPSRYREPSEGGSNPPNKRVVSDATASAPLRAGERLRLTAIRGAKRMADTSTPDWHVQYRYAIEAACGLIDESCDVYGIGFGSLDDSIAKNQIARIYALWSRAKP